MKIVSFAEANKDFKAVLDTVYNNTDVVLINRQNDDDAVVMSRAHYTGLMERLYLLGSSTNAAHLAQSIEQYRAGKVKCEAR